MWVFVRKFRFASVFLFLVQFVNSAYAQTTPHFSFSSYSFDFGISQQSSVPASRTLHIQPAIEDAYGKIVNIRWKSTPLFMKLSSPSPIDEVFSERGIDMTFEADLNTKGYLVDTLLIEIVCSDGGGCVESVDEIELYEIIFSAKIDCINTDSECRPKGPSCVIDFNSEYYVHFSAPNFSENVRETISDVVTTHYSGNKEYSLPLNTIWKLAGLDQLFDEPNGGGCCDCGDTCSVCSTEDCFQEIQFSRTFEFPKIANFNWRSNDGISVSISSIPNPYYDIELTLPPIVDGTSVIGASYVELFFSSADRAPSMVVEWLGPSGDYNSGDIIYDGPILCTGTSRSYAISRHPNGSSQIPRIHLRAAEMMPE